MSGARPTDHLEPAAKKRGSDRQITKDDESDSGGEQEELGTFQRASEDVLKARKIVRARRPGQAKAHQQTAPAAAANPFSGIQLSAGDAKLAAANPFAGIQLTATKPEAPGTTNSTSTAAPPASAAPPTPAVEGGAPPAGGAVPETGATPQTVEKTGAAESEAAAVPQAEAKEQSLTGDEVVAGHGGEATKTELAAKTPALGGFAALSGSGGGAPLFGGLASGGLGGGFGSLASQGAPAAFSFAAAAGADKDDVGKDGTPSNSAPLFSFSTGAAAPAFSFKAPANAPVLSPPTDAGARLGGLTGAGPPEEPQATGEETESLVFSGEGVLFEFDAAKQWRERGSGEVRVLVSGEDPQQARLVMRQKGNLRLLMNANLWADMPVAKMEGGKGATFAVVNAASVEGGADGAEASKDAAAAPTNAQLATFALRIKHPDVLAAFLAAMETYKKPKPASC